LEADDPQGNPDEKIVYIGLASGIDGRTECQAHSGMPVKTQTPFSLVELRSATLTNARGYLSDKPDLTLTIHRTDLEQTMIGAKTLKAQIADGTARFEGDIPILAKLAATMVDFDPRFEIMPGTKLRTEIAKRNPYEAVPGAAIAESLHPNPNQQPKT
jgi:hypothetical protein